MDAFKKLHPRDVRKKVPTILAAISVNSAIMDRILNLTPDKLRRPYNRHGFLPKMREALAIWERELPEI